MGSRAELLLILVAIMSMCIGIRVAIDCYGAVEPDEFWVLLDRHPTLRRIRFSLTADCRITAKEMRQIKRYLETHDHAHECEPLLD